MRVPLWVAYSKLVHWRSSTVVCCTLFFPNLSRRPLLSSLVRIIAMTLYKNKRVLEIQTADTLIKKQIMILTAASYIWARCWNIWICNAVMQCVWRGLHMVGRRPPYLGCEVGGWWFRATTTSIMSSQRTLWASFPWTAYCHLRLQTTALPPPHPYSFWLCATR